MSVTLHVANSIGGIVRELTQNPKTTEAPDKDRILWSSPEAKSVPSFDGFRFHHEF